ncbi:hypothetical protein D3C81_961300 [compost metagenome]
MKDRLFEYYKNNASNRALVLAHMKRFSRWHNIVVFLTMITIALSVLSFIASAIIYALVEDWMLIYFILPVLFIILMYTMNINFNKRAARVLNQHYSIKSEPKKWGSSIKDVKIYFVREYLIENGMYSKWKVIKLIDDLKNDSVKGKLPPLVTPSLIIAFLIPNFTQLISRIYNHDYSITFTANSTYKNYDFTREAFIFTVTATITLICVFSISGMNRIIDLIKELFTDKDKPSREGLIEVLDDILYQIGEE